jgi:FAD/FMN-containing dehydrogenase
VNDIHSRLNECEVAKVVELDSLDSTVAAIRSAAARGLPVAIAGGRHAMGGQQFCAGGVLLDTRRLERVLAFDREAGTIDIEAGIQWPGLLAYLQTEQTGEGPRWGIRQKQTGADRLSLGGAVAANAHGRGLTFPPLVSDVDSLTLVDSRGSVVTCSRTENADLFRLVVGGYGLFGVVYSLRLRLAPLRKLERVVEVRAIDELIDAFDERIRDGFLYGDFQFAIDPRDEFFLQRGVFSCYRPVDDATPIPEAQRALTTDDWKKLLYFAHVDKARAWEAYSTHYLATSGQIYFSDAHQFADYIDGYHVLLDELTGVAEPATEMISEVYVPRDSLAGFMAEVADDFRRSDVDVVYGTVRLIERDEDTFLPWARDAYACIIFNLHTVHTPAGLAQSADAFRRLIDHAAASGGSYFLTYHRWATRDQVLTCHPNFPEFLELKRRFDPDERFQSDWYRHHVALLG